MSYPYSGISLNLEGGWTAYLDRDGKSFHLATDDDRFTHPERGPGLHFVAHSSPLSANYNPLQYNRLLAGFQGQGHLTDWSPIPEHDRHISKRVALIVAYLRNGGSWE